MYSQFPLPSSNPRYPISWPYLERQHVIVLVDGLPWPHWWLSDAEILVNAGPDGNLPGTKLEIMRVTPDLESYADIKDSSNLDADQLNRLRRQLLYLLQERSGAIAGSLGDAINAIANDVGTISAGLDGVNQLIERLTADLQTLAALNASVTVAKNDAAAARAAIITEIAESDAEFAALRERALGLETGAVELGARITSEATTRSTEDDVLAQSITELTASMESGDAALSAVVAAAELARTTADNALASSIESVRVSLEEADTALGARVDSEHTAWSDGDTALGARIDSVDARVTSGTAALSASITSVDQARVSGDAALAARATSLESKVDVPAGQTVSALINSEASTRANADSANAQAVSTLQSTVNGHTTSIAQVTQQSSTTVSRLGTVEAQTVLKTVARADGKTAVAGIGLAASANGQTGVVQSELILTADRLLLTPSGDLNGAATPLMISGTVNGVPTTVFPAARFGDQTIGAKVLIDGSIETRHLKVTGGGGASLWYDPNLQDTTAWQVASWGTYPAFTTVTDGIAGNRTFRTPNAASASMRGVRRVPMTTGKRYRISCFARRSADANGVMYLRVDVGTVETSAFNQLYAGGPALTTYSGTGEGRAVTTAWARYSWEFVPDTTYKFMSPMVLLNHNATAGWMESQDVRIEEMIDSSLVVLGGLAADRIDTRGLSIRDEAGNVIFSAGPPSGQSRIRNTGAVNILDPSTWTVGSVGSQPGFGAIGAAGEDGIVMDTAPDGALRPMWRATSVDDTASGDGGWNTSEFGIDPTKMYRFHCWIRQASDLTGQWYLGIGNQVRDVASGADRDNPYFINGSQATMIAGRWYLAVGYVFPHTYGTAAVGLSGLYDGVTARKVATGADFKWRSTAMATVHRCYLFYADPGAVQDFWGPGVYLCDGNEPSLDQLLAVASIGAGDLAVSAPTVLIPSAGMEVLGATAAKVAGVEAWDSAVRSVDGYVGGAFVSAAVGQANRHLMLALNTDPATDHSYVSLDYAWFVRNDGVLDIYESATGVSTGRAYSAGDVLSITYDGSAIRYWHNGTLVRTVTTTVSGALYLDTSFLSVGAKLNNIRFGPYGNPSAIQRSNPITSSNASTVIANAAIGTAQIGQLTAANLTVQALSDTVNGGAASGGRVVISTNKVSVYDSTGALRTVSGYLL
jgi:hypothetical protein